MPKRTDLRKILLIGSGPIVIGQGCEFDYSGTQACKALRSPARRMQPNAHFFAPGPHFGIIIPQPPPFCNPFSQKTSPAFQLFFIRFAGKKRTFCCIVPIILPFRGLYLPVFRSFLSKRAKKQEKTRQKKISAGREICTTCSSLH